MQLVSIGPVPPNELWSHVDIPEGFREIFGPADMSDEFQRSHIAAWHYETIPGGSIGSAKNGLKMLWLEKIYFIFCEIEILKLELWTII